jgi:hypothetical protein
VRRVCTVPFVGRADPPGTRGISFVKDNVAAALALMVLMALMCCGIPVARVAVVTGILAVVRRIGFPVSLGLAVVIAVIVLMVRQVRASRQRRMLDRWGASAGWSPVPDRTAWPWTAGMPRPGKVDVRLAYEGLAGPFPMVVGEITWTGGALEFDADRLDGRGVFWVIRPSEPWPVAAVQRRHNKSSPPRGTGRFPPAVPVCRGRSVRRRAARGSRRSRGAGSAHRRDGSGVDQHGR